MIKLRVALSQTISPVLVELNGETRRKVARQAYR